MTSTQNITVHVHNYGTLDAESIAASVASAVAPAPAPAPTLRLPAGYSPPMRDETRGALFAAYTAAFGTCYTDRERLQRLAFTRAALGLPTGTGASWSRDGVLTEAHADHLIKLLRVIANMR